MAILLIAPTNHTSLFWMIVSHWILRIRLHYKAFIVWPIRDDSHQNFTKKKLQSTILRHQNYKEQAW